ncbi:MAG: isochorismatase family protein [Paramuribaculum sp.]|nr:isochorismatase family protein [Paramuribaculum sp.]
MEKMLIIVDPQVDFVDGALPVPGAKEAMSALAQYLREHGSEYAVKIITADSHPYNHSSFRECGGEWLRHCVSDSVGAAIVPDVFDAAYSSAGYTAVMHKGKYEMVEEYSVFQAPGATAIIAGLLQKYRITRIDICGLAGDVCVLSTLTDAVGLFPDISIRVLTAFSPSLDGGTRLSAFINENPSICAE